MFPKLWTSSKTITPKFNLSGIQIWTSTPKSISEYLNSNVEHMGHKNGWKTTSSTSASNVFYREEGEKTTSNKINTFTNVHSHEIMWSRAAAKILTINRRCNGTHRNERHWMMGWDGIFQFQEIFSITSIHKESSTRTKLSQFSSLILTQDLGSLSTPLHKKWSKKDKLWIFRSLLPLLVNLITHYFTSHVINSTEEETNPQTLIPMQIQ